MQYNPFCQAFALVVGFLVKEPIMPWRLQQLLMYEKGIDEQLIQEHLGNSSEAVWSYKRTSAKQSMEISEILYGNGKKPKVEKLDMVKMGTVPTMKCETISKPSESVEMSGSSTSSTQTTVNYSYHGIQGLDAPIVNIPGGVPPNQPIVINCQHCSEQVKNVWTSWINSGGYEEMPQDTWKYLVSLYE